MKRPLCILCALLSLLLLSLAHGANEPNKTPAVPKRAEVPERAVLEKQFAESLSGATLVGYFTVNGKEAQGLKEEKYRLKQVKKLPTGDYWLFEYQYGDKGTAIPLPLEVKWAGDTPVITLTDMAIPGVGTFTARVLFYRDEYAGTWGASDHGGRLFGKVVRDNDDEKAEADKKKDEKKP